MRYISIVIFCFYSLSANADLNDKSTERFIKKYLIGDLPRDYIFRTEIDKDGAEVLSYSFKGETNALKICKNPGGGIQKFSFFIHANNSLSLIAKDAVIGASVDLQNSSVCNLDADTFIEVETSEIRNSFVQGEFIASSKIYESEVKNSTVFNCKVFGGAYIEDSIVEGHTHSSGSSSNIWNARVTGESEISGLFAILSDVESIKIVGALEPSVHGQSDYSIYISDEATIGSNVEMTGHVRVFNGFIGAGVKLIGTKGNTSTCESCEGITVNPGSEVTGANTVLSGYLWVGDGSEIHNSRLTILRPFDDQWSRLHATQIIDSVITGSIASSGVLIEDQTLTGDFSCSPVSGCVGVVLNNYIK